MNQNLPKPLLDALTRQPLPTDHPAADLLTAFAENALAGDEYRRIADHLARCGGCREIVFLASSAADKPLEVEGQVAAAHGSRRRWTPRLVWGASIAAAVVVVASALILWRRESALPQMQMASRAVSTPPAQPIQQSQESQLAEESRPATESKPEATPQTTAEMVAPAAVAKSQTKTIRAKAVSPRGAETLGVGSSAGIVASATPEAAKAAPANSATAAKAAPTVTVAGRTTTIAIGGRAATMAPAAPHANSFAAVQGGPIGAAPGSADKLLLNPAATARSMRSAHPQWRITADGHLEHLTAEGWTRVLADRTATFRVVSVMGNHVWVGGSGGTLFHSRDEGQNWEEVALSRPNGRDTSTIVSIQFDDPQHGTVTTETGARCSTTDGGGTWSCQ